MDDDRRDEIVNLYRLALGRAPEPGADLSALADMDRAAMAAVFFQSGEFRDRVADAYLRGGEPREADFDYPPSQSLRDWVAATFPLSDRAPAVIAARSWAQLYRALFADDAAVFGLEQRPFEDRAWAALLSQAAADDVRRVMGAVDNVAPDRVAGWALDLADPQRPMALELWIDGVFAGAGATGVFRRDIQERFGAQTAGFELIVPAGAASGGAERRLEVREAGHPAPIGTGVLSGPNPQEILAYEAVRRELAQVRQTLGRLEAMLPAVEGALTRRAGDWSDYFDAWYRPAHDAIRAAQPSAAAPGRVRIRIDAADCPGGWVEEALDSALEQSVPPAGVFVVGLDDQGRRLLGDLIARRGWAAPTITVGEPPAGQGPVLAFAASGLLAPDAVEAVQALFDARPDTVVAYVDEDQLAAETDGPDDWRRRAHAAPVLKPSFDLDYLRQSPWVGDCLAFADAVGEGFADGPRAVLAAAEAGGQIASIPRVLFSRRAEAPVAPDADAWAETVRAHLTRMCETAQVAPQTDILGAVVPGAVRVRHAVPQGARSTVIIPTRDRLDLLRPCLDSLQAHRDANRCAMTVRVVDHDSRDAQVRALLDARRAAGQIEITPYDGDFNWALMNNLAAQASDGEVLVFLNDDTVVISPDWLDALVAQALRPGVGAVGARLVYQDGTLQHAGMVARPRPDAFLIHEGVGRPGADAGWMGRHALAHRSVSVTGACMAVSAQVFQRLGGFDATRLPVEGNDADFCLRAQDQGLAVIYEPGATLYHLESKSRGLSQDGERLRASAQATARLWRRWGEGFADDPGFNPHFARDGRPFDRLKPPPPVGR